MLKYQSKKILFVHCCYREHLRWIMPIIQFFLNNGFVCHLYPTHWDRYFLNMLNGIFNNKRFKLVLSPNKFFYFISSIYNAFLKKLQVYSYEKQVAIESYKLPGHKFLKKGKPIPCGFYNSRIFDIVRLNRKYQYDALIAHGIDANVIANFAWYYMNCPKWVSDRGFIYGSVMLDKHSTSDDRSELQNVQISEMSLSNESKRLCENLEKPLVEFQTSRNFQKPKSGKNLLYVLSRIQNEVNIKGCLSGLTELQIIDALWKNLPPGWNLTLKVRGTYRSILDNYKPPQNVYIAEGNTDIYYLIEMSDAVISFISKIGIQAALLNKVVLTMGSAHYSHFGFTRDLNDISQLKEILEKTSLTEDELKKRDSFLEYYLHNYLIFPNRVRNPKLDNIIRTIS